MTENPKLLGRNTENGIEAFYFLGSFMETQVIPLLELIGKTLQKPAGTLNYYRKVTYEGLSKPNPETVIYIYPPAQHN